MTKKDNSCMCIEKCYRYVASKEKEIDGLISKKKTGVKIHSDKKTCPKA